MPATSAAPTLLIADDDETVRRLLRYQATKQGFNPILATSGNEALDLLKDHNPEVVLLDLHMPDGDGISCLEKLSESHPEIPAVMLSSADEAKDAVAAMKAGAVDYLTKPFDLDELFQVIRKAIDLGRMQRENRELKEAIGTSKPRSGIIGNSPVTRELVDKAERVGALDATILLTGESGVGKSLLARTIHYASTRSEKPFVTVSCPAIPRDILESELFGHEKGAFTGAINRRIGKIEMAAGGTIFLDEIGDLPLDLQPKLLNVLQDREFQRIGGNDTITADVRVITATNVNLRDKVSSGEFREDLFYRLNVIPVEIPPLRDRREDIPDLAHFILTRIADGHNTPPVHLSPEALARLEAYPWPGNIRQLENALERAAAFCKNDTITPTDLVLPNAPPPNTPTHPTPINQTDPPPAPDSPKTLANIPLRELEKQAIIETLAANQGNKAATARHLGITEKSIYNKIKRFGIDG